MLKKIIGTMAVAALLAAPTHEAAAQAFQKGSKVLSLGVMAGGDYEGFGGGGSFEVGILEIAPKIKLGVGGLIGYVRDSESFGLSDYTLSVMPIMAIGNVHFEVPNQPKLDLYAGASAGIIRVSYSGDFVGIPGVSASDSDTGFGIQGGIRYGVNDKTSLMGQIGFGDIPLLFAGVSFKF